MPLVRRSACKVNFVLNILGRRPDGFHELETLFFPLPLYDELRFERSPTGIALTCSNPHLPLDGKNLVQRAATEWWKASGVSGGVQIHLEKHLPLAAGLGAGSANAATTLLGLNELFGNPLSPAHLETLAAGLGSDVNFFLQDDPALAFGRGERIEPVASFRVLRGTALLLFHPGFGVPTPWVYRELADFPSQREGVPGRAATVARQLQEEDLPGAIAGWYNALEAPVFRKYPVLALCQELLRGLGALGTLMSGSGSTTFALFASVEAAEAAIPRFRHDFGERGWLEVVAL